MTALTAGGGDPNVMLKRVEQAVKQLDLNDSQRGQVEQIFKQGAGDITNAAPDLLNASPEDKAAKYREILSDVREQLAGVLTDDQKQQLRDKMQSLRNSAGESVATTAPSGQPASSQPSTVARANTRNGAGSGGQGRGAQMLQRFKDALSQLDLTDDQKTKTDAVLEDMTAQIKQIRQSVRNGSTSRDDVREKVAGVLQDALPKLGEILTPDQKTKLRSILQEENGGNGKRLRGNNSNSTTGPTTAPTALPPGTVDAKDAASPVAPVAVTSTPGTKTPGTSSPGTSTAVTPAAATPAVIPVAVVNAAPLDLGQPAPDFQLKKTNGESASLADAKHHILALVFASASAPAFRDHAPGLNALHEKYASRGVEFLVVYTKEQHPVGGWELQRNKDDNINIPLAKSIADRETAARQLRDALHLAEPVAVDSMDDHVAVAYGVNQTVPAFVIDRDGNVAFHQSWLEPDTLGHALDDALSNTR